MTDILDELKSAVNASLPVGEDLLIKAASEIAQLRVKNTELNRRSQKAEAAARDTYVEAQRHGISAGRVLANHAAGMWRDLALVLADELLWRIRTAGHIDQQKKEVIDEHWFNEGFFCGLVLRWLAKGEVFRDEVDKARGRLEAYQYNGESGCPVEESATDTHAPMPPVKPPRKPMTKEELARAMYELDHGWDSLGHDQKQQWVMAAEEAISKTGAD